MATGYGVSAYARVAYADTPESPSVVLDGYGTPVYGDVPFGGLTTASSSSSSATPSLISAVGTMYTPTINDTSTPSVISAVGTVYTPTVNDIKITTVISATGSVFTPTILATGVSTPSNISATGTVYTPLITTSAGFLLLGDNSSRLLLGDNSSRLLLGTPASGATPTPAAIAAVGTVFTPTVPAQVAPGVISATGTVFSPTKQATASPTVITATGTVFAPGLVGPLGIASTCWYDVSATGWISTSGSAVTDLLDRSGNGRNIAQSTGANCPTLVSNLFGALPGVQFDGTNDYFGPSSHALSTLITSTSFCIVLAFRARSSDTSNSSADANDGVFGEFGGFLPLGLRSTGEMVAFLWDGGAKQVSVTANPGFGTSGLHVATLWLESGTFHLDVNGTEASIASGSVASLTGGMYIGRISTANNYGNIDFGEIAWFNSALTPTNRTNLRTYLLSKWGGNPVTTQIAATATVNAPSIATTKTPATISATATVSTPTIDTGGSTTVSPSVISATATVFSPTGLPRSEPSTISATGTVFTPTISVPTPTPATISAVGTVFTPVIIVPGSGFFAKVGSVPILS